jgi:predicted Zn-dependent protease
MNHIFKRASVRRAAIFAAVAILAACQSTTEGGAVGANRSQFVLMPASSINTAAAQFYNETLSKAKAKGALNNDSTETQRVRLIAQRLIPHTAAFRKDAPGWAWEVNVIDSPDVNAFCAPGGKIAVYTGLIEKLKATDEEIAAVMGHEIAHALREHGRERASRQYAVGLGAALLGAGTGIGSDLPNLIGNVTLNLPNSRDNEAEADRIGIELAARAGYNPRAAISLWQKMATQGGGKGPEFLSTHPSGPSRIADIERTLPAVQPLYLAAKR